MQTPVCAPEQMECVANISIESQDCLNKCSGLQVASFDASKKYQLEKFLSKLSTDYWNYKGFFKFPAEFKGR